MSIIELKTVRRRHKRAYLNRIETDMKFFIKNVFKNDLASDYKLLCDYYHSRVWEMSSQGSDFWHLRDFLAVCFGGLFEIKIETLLKEKKWYRKDLLSHDDIINAFVNEFIYVMEIESRRSKADFGYNKKPRLQICW